MINMVSIKKYNKPFDPRRNTIRDNTLSCTIITETAKFDDSQCYTSIKDNITLCDLAY